MLGRCHGNKKLLRHWVSVHSKCCHYHSGNCSSVQRGSGDTGRPRRSHRGRPTCLVCLQQAVLFKNGRHEGEVKRDELDTRTVVKLVLELNPGREKASSERF